MRLVVSPVHLLLFSWPLLPLLFVDAALPPPWLSESSSPVLLADDAPALPSPSELSPLAPQLVSCAPVLLEPSERSLFLLPSDVHDLLKTSQTSCLIPIPKT